MGVATDIYSCLLIFVLIHYRMPARHRRFLCVVVSRSKFMLTRLFCHVKTFQTIRDSMRIFEDGSVFTPAIIAVRCHSQNAPRLMAVIFLDGLLHGAITSDCPPLPSSLSLPALLLSLWFWLVVGFGWPWESRGTPRLPALSRAGQQGNLS